MPGNRYKEKYHWLLERDAYIAMAALFILFGTLMQFFGAFWMNLGGNLIASGIVGIMALYILYVQRQIETERTKFRHWGLENIFPNRSDRDIYKPFIDNCQRRLDIQAVTLSRFYSDFKEELKILDKKDVKMRLLLLDPGSPLCQRRENEAESAERANLSDKIKKQTKDFFKLGLKNLQIRWYDCTPSVNYFRVDDIAFFGSYFVGIVSRNSLTFLGRVNSAAVGWYQNHFEKVWEGYSRDVPNEWQK